MSLTEANQPNTPDRPTIAVVIPLYNKGPHVVRALASVLAQTRLPEEIIVIDDASSDDGVERILDLKDPRIRILKRDLPGPGGYAARNLGIETARSSWIAFLDADDAWFPNALEEAEKLMRSADTDTSCVFLRYENEYGDGRHRPSSHVPRASGSKIGLATFIDDWLATGYCPMWTSAVAARRQVLLTIGGFPAGKCDRGGDKDTWIRLVQAGKAVYGSAVGALYFRNSVNMVTRNTAVNSRPYLCYTLEKMLLQADSKLALRLRRLMNHEMFARARETWRLRARVDKGVFAGFFIGTDPVKYVLLRLMAGAPDSIMQFSHLLRRNKGLLRKQPASDQRSGS